MDVKKEKLLNRLSKRLNEFKEKREISHQLVDAKWRQILSYDWMDRQKGKLEELKAYYLRKIDHCDSIVSRLEEWMEHSEKQYQFNSRSHKAALDNLSDLALRRLGTEQKRWETRLNTIVNDFEDEVEKHTTMFNKHVEETKDVIHATNYEYNNTKKAFSNRFRYERDQLIQRNQGAISALQTHLMDQISKVDQAMKVANEEFKSKSEGKMQQFHQLFEEHKARQREMKKNEETIIRNTAEIAHWKRKIKNNERESKEENDRLRQEKENLSLHFRELKDIMAHFRDTESKKLAEISVAFEDAVKNMNEKLRLAEKILKYAEMNRKLETEREQVMPFTVSITESDPEIVRQMKNFKAQLKGDSKLVDDSDMFDLFYRRYNKVLLETLSLQRECETLLDTNKRLKKMLRKYIDGMGVSPELNENPNTLVVVNQVTNAPKYEFDNDTIPIIDADLTIHANELQGYNYKEPF